LQLQEESGPAAGLPRVWILQSPHSGDNTQLRALAGALGWPVEAKRLTYRRHEAILRLFSLASLAGVDLAKSSPLAPPWPDLVLCSGRGAEAVSFWLREHANPDLRIVFVGTPWADLRRFDLVITTPQYRLPQAPNVLHNLLPLHDVTAERIAAEAARWQARLSHLPQPFMAVLAGGGSGPYLFTPAAAARLGREASALARADGGSLLVTTSARTGEAATEALAGAIDVPFEMFRWRGDAADNPFHAFLGLASRIIVTADSISMLSEAVSTRKPVLLFDIEDGPFAMRAEEASEAGLIAWRGRNSDATLFRLLINHAPPKFSRDLRIVHRQLLAAGHARWLGEESVAAPLAAAPPEEGLARATARIRGLFGL
jgi:mitochondrial fission protein ELM1